MLTRIDRSSPWPYTFRLNGVGLMGGTAKRQSTEYVAHKPPSQAAVAPPAYGYGADPPDFGTTTSYQQMRLGMGLAAQRGQDASADEQYNYALGVDFSVYPWVVGPDVTTFTPATTDATNGVTGFMKVGSVLYAVTGRYALKRVNDSSWTAEQDFGASKVSLDCVAFYSNAHAAAYGLVAMGDADNFWYVSAGSWTQHASLKALAWGVAARELYRGHTTNTLSKVDLDADWTVAANWGNEYAFDVGDQSSAIVRLPTTADGTLIAVKTDGRYTLQGINDPNPGYDKKLQDFVPDAANGKAVARWGNELYLGTTYAGFWRVSSDGSAHEQCGPELLTDGSSTVTGYVTACAGTQWALYGAFYNPDSGSSYLCKFVGMREVAGQATRVPIWHGSLTQALGSKVTAMAVDAAGAAAGHQRLYLGFANGSLGWFTLPCTPHPADCSSYRFTTTSGIGYLPRWHGGFPANDKALEAYTVTAPNLTATRYAQIGYRTEPGGAFASVSSNFDSASREKVELPNGLAATTVDTRLTLVNPANTASPQITGVGLHHQLHTPLRLAFEIRVLADDGLLRRDGTPLRIGRSRIIDVVEAAADTAGGVPLVLPDGSSKQVRVRGIGHASAWTHGPRQCRAYVLECVEVRTTTVRGTHARIMALGSHAAMQGYTHGQLQAI